MKLNNFRGELTDISAKKVPLTATSWNQAVQLPTKAEETILDPFSSKHKRSRLDYQWFLLAEMSVRSPRKKIHSHHL